jgi:hypothetical protein
MPRDFNAFVATRKYVAEFLDSATREQRHFIHWHNVKVVELGSTDPVCWPYTYGSVAFGGPA